MIYCHTGYFSRLYWCDLQVPISLHTYHNAKTITEFEKRIDNWIITKWLIFTTVDFNLLPKAQIHSTLPYLSFALNFPTQGLSGELCPKECCTVTVPERVDESEESSCPLHC